MVLIERMNSKQCHSEGVKNHNKMRILLLRKRGPKIILILTLRTYQLLTILHKLCVWDELPSTTRAYTFWSAGLREAKSISVQNNLDETTVTRLDLRRLRILYRDWLLALAPLGRGLA
jgi:hypothetical protein